MSNSPEKTDVPKNAPTNEDEEKDKEKGDKHGQKRAVEEEKEDITNKVSSPNDWEHADLGDAGRKNKFLRLMGAAKKEHHGKIVIGDQPEHKQTGNVDKMYHDLEQQFQHGMDHKLKGGMKKHLGLGFQDEDEEETNKEKVENKDNAKESSQDKPLDLSQVQEDLETNKTNEAAPNKKDKTSKMAGFVKGSS